MNAIKKKKLTCRNLKTTVQSCEMMMVPRKKEKHAKVTITCVIAGEKYHLSAFLGEKKHRG
jgi:hypothetical protein